MMSFYAAAAVGLVGRPVEAHGGRWRRLQFTDILSTASSNHRGHRWQASSMHYTRATRAHFLLCWKGFLEKWFLRSPAREVFFFVT
uniref:Putative secreted protein n=1 Tax=Anopheles marajoara TaxID=58244 RepID=A0A2M4CAL7_9DIPT